ncbi:MAG: DUF4347 domain-containing protein [Methylococcaceae bacterium]|nr:DUF4347 domain-containing protein [Methylococcaceae bacterium]
MIHKLSWVARLFKRLSAQVASTRPEKNARFIIEEMESRKLFSADPIAGLLEIDNFEPPQVETLVVDHVSELYNNNSSSTIPDDISSTNIEIRHELVFVDAGVENYEQLIDDLNSQGNGSRIFSVFILDSGKNGIEQITNELQNYGDVDAIHILSHGTQGSVSLGNIQLNSENLSQYDTQISLWQNSLEKNADILFYGCELVGNEAGENLTTKLSLLTGADVAASVDDTGSTAQGGDWELEFSTGVIETEIAISEKTQQSWDGLLAYQTYRDEFDTISFENTNGSIDWTGNPWIELGETNGANAGKLIVSTELGEQGLSISNFNNGAQREVDLSGASNATLSFEYARIGLDDALDSITLSISIDGGGNWYTLDSWQGSANDTSLNYANYDISNYIASNTQIKFISSGLTENGDKFFVDNFQVAYSNDLDTKSEFLVNQNTANVQITSGATRGSQQSVAVASNGDYVVVWTEVESAGGLSDVFAQQYRADGTIKTAAFQVNTTSIGEQQWASVASDASGQFVITWTGDSQDGNDQQVYFKRFNANGSAIDVGDVLVNSGNITGNQHSVSVALNSQGNMVITWQSDEVGSEGVYARLFDMTSATTGNEVQTSLITVASGTNQLNPAVDINSEGKFVIAWQKGDKPYVQRFNSNGSLRGSQININPLNFGFGVEKYPVVAIQESGEFLIAYRSEILKGVWVKHYSDDGSAKAIATKVGSSSDTAHSIAKDLNGNFILIYESDGDGEGQGIFARRYDSSQNALEAAFQINETNLGNQHMASVAMLDLNNYVAVWSGNGPGDSNGVFARQFNTGSPNSLPTADASAGTPYVINEGDSVTLNGASSSDPDSDTLTYLWDLDNDLVYGDVVGVNPIISWAALQGKGIADEGSYIIGLQVKDGRGGIATATTTLTVKNTAPTLSTTGAATVAQGGVYTLNLSAVDPGADMISSWTINWGDGAIETYAGNPSSVTHTYTNGGFTNNILVSAIDEDGIHLQNDLLVTDYTGTGGIFHFSETGEFLDPAIGTSDLDKSVAVIVGPDGNWYGSGELSGNVYRYNTDGGASKVIMGGFGEAGGLAFDSDGNLLIASMAQNKIYKLTHNTSDDSYTKTEIVSDAAFNGPYGLIFGPNSDLYVSSYADHNVQRLALNTDRSYTASVFISDGLGGLNSPEQMAFGPDGKLYLTSAGSNDIFRFNPESLSLDVIATLPSGGKPEGLAFGPDGNLYISDYDFGDIIRFKMVVNGTTGELEVQGVGEIFIDGTNSTLTKPVFMAFVPEQQVKVINANQTPVITDQSFSLLENSADNSVVGTVIASDTDGDTLIYSITAGNTNNAFAINSSTGEITVNDGNQLDYETTPVFNLTVQVSDGNLTDTAAISLNVTDINESPVINDQSFSLLENSADNSVVGTVTASDTDSDTLIYSITAGNTNNAFAINSSTGEITVNDSNQLDYETTPVFNLTVQVSDGNLTDTATISLNLTEIKELSNSIFLSNNRIDEHVDSSTGITIGVLTSSDENAHSYQINGGADQEKFFIGGSANNELFLNDGVLDFEKQSSYQVTVSAIDSKGAGHNETFIVKVNNLNELPVITSSNLFTLEENISNIATVIAEDKDQPVQKLSYFLSGGADRALFLLDNETGELSFKTAPDFETPSDSNAENVYKIEITVDDGNGGTFSQPVSIQIENAAEAPELSNQSVSIEEQSNAGAIVTTLVANDPDANETFSYSIIEGNLSDAFSIDNMGQLIVSNPELLINQDNSSVSLVVQVTDSQGLTDTSVVLIEIRSIIPDTSISKTEAELEKQDAFVFSVFTEIPTEDVTNLTKNETGSISELNEPENSEQATTENNTVIENTENKGINKGQGAAELEILGVEAETIQEKFSFSTSKNSENSWTSKNIIIKAKAQIINNVLSPQFSYFDIEANVLKTLIEESGFSERLDELREQIQENTHFEKTIVGSSITLTTGLSIGYVIWLVRGGVLLSSVLSTLPAWRMIDPLPVISSLNGALDNDENGDTLASLIKKGSAVVKAKVQTSIPPSN